MLEIPCVGGPADGEVVKVDPGAEPADVVQFPTFRGRRHTHPTIGLSVMAFEAASYRLGWWVDAGGRRCLRYHYEPGPTP